MIDRRVLGYQNSRVNSSTRPCSISGIMVAGLGIVGWRGWGHMCSRVRGVRRRGWGVGVGEYWDVDRWWLASIRGCEWLLDLFGWG